MGERRTNRERTAAFAAGVLGAAAMTAASAASRTGVMSELQRLAGTVVAPPGSSVSRALGAAAQFVNGGLLAQLYLPAFDRLPAGPTWQAGLAVGVAHGVVAGLFLAAVPALHPRVPQQLTPPGPFLLNRGLGAAAVLIGLHALYGATVGEVCRRRSRAHFFVR